MTGLPIVRPSLIDRAVAAVSPVRALERVHARARLAAYDRMTDPTASDARGGSYAGASSHKPSLIGWMTRALSPNRDTLPELVKLRANSRDLARNAAVAVGAINSQVNAVVGAGLTAKPSIDRAVLGLKDEAAEEWEARASRVWSLASESVELDAARTLNFAGLTDLTFRSALLSGDVFAFRLYFARPGSPFMTKIQIVEADRVSNPNRKPDSLQIAGGVEVDGYGAPVAYHVTDRHPGDGVAGLTWSRVAAFGEQSGLRNVLHVYKPERPGQRRGVPYLAPVIELIKQLDRHTEAEIMAAVMNSCFAIKRKSNGGGGGLAGDQAPGEAPAPLVITEPGLIVDLGDDEELDPFTPGRPSSNFEPFFVAIVKQIGVALDIPHEVLMRNFSASYSASRAALELFWQTVQTRRGWLLSAWATPTYEAVITEAVARGWLDAPGFFRDPMVRAAWLGVQWTGQRQPVLDEVKAANAARLRIENGTSTEQRESAAIGNDWERDHVQRAKEARMRRDAGLPVLGVAAAPSLPAPRSTDPAEGAEDGTDQEDKSNE
jgi:lambda family phage portal protein